MKRHLFSYTAMFDADEKDVRTALSGIIDTDPYTRHWKKYYGVLLPQIKFRKKGFFFYEITGRISAAEGRTILEAYISYVSLLIIYASAIIFMGLFALTLAFVIFSGIKAVAPLLLFFFTGFILSPLIARAYCFMHLKKNMQKLVP